MTSIQKEMSKEEKQKHPPSEEYVKGLEKKVQHLEDTEKAILNVLEDARVLEAQLRNQTEELKKFHMAAEESSDHMIITDPDGVILYANPAVEKITGFGKEETLKNTPSLWGKQMKKEFYEKFWHTIKDEKQKFSGEIINKRKTGEQYVAEISIVPLLDEKNDVQFFVGVERDVTEQRKYEDQLITQAKDLENINEELQREKDERDSILRFLRSIGDGVIAVDLGGNVLFVNETASQLIMVPSLSADKREMKGVRCKELFWIASEKRPDDSIDFLERIVGGEKSLEDTHAVLLRSDKSMIPIAYSVSPIRGEDERLLGCMLIIKDMTDEREVDSAKDRFLSVAAHQLRTPLSGMRWHMEMLLDGDVGEISPEVKEVIEQVHENTLRMAGLINDLLNVALLDAGQDQGSSGPVNVVETVKSSIDELKLFAEKLKISLDLFVSENSHEWSVRSLPRRLYEICENLIHNAIKYSRSGSTVSIRVEASKKEGFCVLTVSDTGIGIPKAEREKIFGKFFRASNAFRWRTEGTGLGLCVVKSFAEEMGGSITFESEEGEGTKFIVEFPIAKKENA